MLKKLSCFLFSMSVGFAVQTYADDATTWDLSEIYATKADWAQARESMKDDLANIEKVKGTLGKSPKHMQKGLDTISDAYRKMLRVYSYSSMLSDEDLRNTEHLEMDQLSTISFGELGKAISWFEPEVLAIGSKKIEKFIRKNPELEKYRHPLDEILLAEPHTLDAEGEKLLAQFAATMSAPQTTYGVLANSDIPWPEIAMADGKKYRIDSQGYTRWRSSQDRALRKKVFDAYWGRWEEYRASVGSVLYAHVQNQVAMARARNYNSVLEKELNQDNLPEAVYRTLVEEVNAALPTLHRYFKLRKQIMGVDQLRYYDMYPSLVKLDKKFDYETSKQITLDAMSVLGDDWVSRQRDGMNKRWAHVYPQQGKRSGAYMNSGAYDVHPYLLLNHNDDYNGLSTLAHEWGHAMHTLYSVESQPFPTYNYATFIAEIPSTSLELILQDYMVSHAKSNQEKIFYLGEGLENLRTTFFRQAMFAEFELELYERVEKGEALTGEKMSQIYGDLLKRYHGDAEGVVKIDDLYTNEWMFIPHFYNNMYVFQYATSITAGTALYDSIVKDGQAGVDNYINLLRAGSSDYPYNLLTKAGVDLAKPAPYRALIKKMNAIMDEMEALLAEAS
ncbi:oligoendopeptidase F [Teredinibacter turnerae]|uniref:oligoendopeptidase F n=1 Tax=Teredinibacter turnerae TaxID=2426 RepID=UPI0005F77965|nr:oligoendopeptidase F [Teredinibacter turnerae]